MELGRRRGVRGRVSRVGWRRGVVRVVRRRVDGRVRRGWVIRRRVLSGRRERTGRSSSRGSGCGGRRGTGDRRRCDHGSAGRRRWRSGRGRIPRRWQASGRRRRGGRRNRRQLLCGRRECVTRRWLRVRVRHRAGVPLRVRWLRARRGVGRRRCRRRPAWEGERRLWRRLNDGWRLVRALQRRVGWRHGAARVGDWRQPDRRRHRHHRRRWRRVHERHERARRQTHRERLVRVMHAWPNAFDGRQPRHR